MQPGDIRGYGQSLHLRRGRRFEPQPGMNERTPQRFGRGRPLALPVSSHPTTPSFKASLAESDGFDPREALRVHVGAFGNAAAHPAQYRVKPGSEKIFSGTAFLALTGPRETCQMAQACAPAPGLSR